MTDSQLLSLRQLASRYGVSRETIRRWRKEGTLPPPDIIRPRIRWSRAALEAWETDGEACQNPATFAQKAPQTGQYGQALGDMTWA